MQTSGWEIALLGRRFRAQVVQHLEDLFPLGPHAKAFREVHPPDQSGGVYEELGGSGDILRAMSSTVEPQDSLGGLVRRQAGKCQGLLGGILRARSNWQGEMGAFSPTLGAPFDGGSCPTTADPTSTVAARATWSRRNALRNCIWLLWLVLLTRSVQLKLPKFGRRGALFRCALDLANNMATGLRPSTEGPF